MSPRSPVTLILPVKSLARAKSRLGVEPALRAQVALALMLHTATMATRCAVIGQVIVVTRDPVVRSLATRIGACVRPEPQDSDLNTAAELGRRTARSMRPDHPIAVLVSDLPWLKASELTLALQQLNACSPLMVEDSLGTGTTMLAHLSSQNPPILFGPGSAQAHKVAGYRPVRGPLFGLRHDLDTLADLKPKTLDGQERGEMIDVSWRALRRNERSPAYVGGLP